MTSTSVRDTIHGYIELDPFEKAVVDSPWFQRLRRVRQNDVASYVYPTMLTTRFEHSLGAMHLAGECLEAALRDRETKLGVDSFITFLGGELATRLSVHVASDKLAFFARRCARMYGLLHDIGHPPYSHLIEACYTPADIGIAGGPRDHWHESNGAQIVEELLPETLSPPQEDLDVLKTTAHLATKGVKTPALYALKELVDSVIDVDRMDFVLRDGRNSGSEFGLYDLQRLVGSFRVHVDDVGGKAQTILIRPLHKAVSAIESLIQERYKIYRWVLFHHRVMQSRALMRYVLRQTASDPDFDPRQFQARNYVPELPPPSEDAKKFGHVLLGDGVVDQHLDRHLRTLLSKKGSLTPDESRLLNALRILVLREERGVSLWKRTDMYNNERDADSFESQLREAFKEGAPAPPHRRVIDGHGSYANWVADVLNREGNEDILKTVIETLNSSGSSSEWYLLEIPGFKKSGDDRILVPGDAPGKLKPDFFSDISTVARAIDAARRDDVHLFAFCFTDKIPTGIEKNRMKRDGRARLAKAIAALYRSKPTLRDQFEPASK